MYEPVVARLHGLIRQVVDEALVERLLSRLENDGQFVETSVMVRHLVAM